MTATHAPRRIESLRHLMHPMHLRQSAAVARQPRLAVPLLISAQAGITTALALLAVLASPWASLVGFAALGALVALFGRGVTHRQRGWVVLAAGGLQVSAIAGMSTLTWLGVPVWGQLLALAVMAGLFFFASTSAPFGPPGALIFVFAGSAGMMPVTSGLEVLERGAATAAVALLALAVVLSTDWLRPAPAQPEAPMPLPARRMIALRVAVGTALAMLVSHAAGMDHPGWAAMGAQVVLQGTHLHLSLNRAMQRMVGTLFGAGVAWVCLASDPGIVGVILLLVALQVATELVIGANYAFGQVLITPMALLMMALASPQAEAGALATERVLDTFLGVVIGMGVALVLSTIEDRRALARHCAA
ncbi:FUSC family protein [Pararhodobacter sp. CCB-MM2]|uniref:FUSC family protein n=1 Tax=Pararhodobacter sp. CCB-MM2 TaxID=1786003 RepID=UPI0008362AA5|nr:FUSC family protein [Pararhodobacter sp. CCB-MM2]